MSEEPVYFSKQIDYKKIRASAQECFGTLAGKTVLRWLQDEFVLNEPLTNADAALIRQGQIMVVFAIMEQLLPDIEVEHE